MQLLNKRIVWFISSALLSFVFLFAYKKADTHIQKCGLVERSKQSVMDDDFAQIGLLPLTFIGGTLRSGTTLMRTMLDVHPNITCGPESFVLPKVLAAIHSVKHVLKGSGMLQMGIHGNMSIIDKAVQQFIYTVVVEGKESSKYYCNKDPANLIFLDKFILMLRDLRAVAYSHLKNGKGIDGYRSLLSSLNGAYEIMIEQCEASDQCILQEYEQLVLQPIKETKKIFNFLNIPWVEEVLRHEKHLEGINFNSRELTTIDAQKPLYLDGLTKWVGQIPNDVLKDVEKLAPIMARMGYDVKNKVPYYGEPDDFVLKRGEWKNT